MTDKIIINAIHEYAVAYRKLQEIQETMHSIPKGDQKTGCIGEYYSYRYLKRNNPNAILEYGSHSEKGWDIFVKTNSIKIKIQVKTVSAYSKTRTISPIHKGWDILHLIYLSKSLYPEGFWIIDSDDIFGLKDELKGKKCPLPNNPNTGSRDISYGKNKVDELLRMLNS